MDENGAPLAGALLIVGGPEVITDASAGPRSQIGKKWWRANTSLTGSYALDGLYSGVELSSEVQQGCEEIPTLR